MPRKRSTHANTKEWISSSAFKHSRYKFTVIGNNAISFIASNASNFHNDYSVQNRYKELKTFIEVNNIQYNDIGIHVNKVSNIIPRFEIYAKISSSLSYPGYVDFADDEYNYIYLGLIPKDLYLKFLIDNYNSLSYDDIKTYLSNNLKLVNIVDSIYWTGYLNAEFHLTSNIPDFMQVGELNASTENEDVNYSSNLTTDVTIENQTVTFGNDNIDIVKVSKEIGHYLNTLILTEVIEKALL